MLVYVVYTRVPLLIFNVGACAVEDYTIGRRGRGTHQSKFVGVAVGNKVLRQGRHMERSGFCRDGMGWEDAWKGARERGMRGDESPGCTG